MAVRRGLHIVEGRVAVIDEDAGRREFGAGDAFGRGNAIPLRDSLSLGWSALRVLIGIALVPVAARTCCGLAAGTARTARTVLG